MWIRSICCEADLKYFHEPTADGTLFCYKDASLLGAVMSKRDVLSILTFGERVAEDEVSLTDYFVETDQWQRIFRGDVDVVYGPKGSGKSALYLLLLKREAEFASKNVIVMPAENIRGTPVFSELAKSPSLTESELSVLWKTYFLSLIGDQFFHKDYANNSNAREVISALQDAGLASRGESLQAKLKAAIMFVKGLFTNSSLEGTLNFDPVLGTPSGIGAKLSYLKPSSTLATKTAFSGESINRLLKLADKALDESGKTAWLLLDRLDVAFADQETLEENALRALFRVYLDLKDLSSVALKIFLRDDIWSRITASGFREASHITRTTTISWDEQGTMNLIVRRLLQNDSVIQHYNINRDEILKSAPLQAVLFYRIFPDKVASGARQSTTLDWLIKRTSDGTDRWAPREVIHLLNVARDIQLQKLEQGEAEPEGDTLFSKSVIREALPEVSKVRLNQTLYAEHPKLRIYIEALVSEKTKQSPRSLAEIWRVSQEDARKIALKLVDIGFFALKGTKEAPEYGVPFLYRSGLKMIQGSAD